MNVRPKKNLGQHFLTDQSIALQIVKSLQDKSNYKKVLEIGAGMGVLTQYLLNETVFETSVIDIDKESIQYLKQHFPTLSQRIIEGDFLRINLSEIFNEPIAIIGNFPYNISTEILFKILDNKDLVPEVVGMFQKEVAERIASKPGSRIYGVTSVLLQAYYTIDYLFTVDENVFNPPPKVKSGVIRLTRNATKHLNCNEKKFTQVVKASFSQRRKMLRNALKPFEFKPEFENNQYLTERAEQLSVDNFVELTNMLV